MTKDLRNGTTPDWAVLRVANHVMIWVHTWNRPQKERKRNHQTYTLQGSWNQENCFPHTKTRNGHKLNDLNLQDQLKEEMTDPSPHPPTKGPY